MKNIFNKFAFFIALSFVFISCGNLTTSENDDSIPRGKGKIAISTDLQNGRSVLPTAIKEDTTGLKWELVGTSGDKTYSKIWYDDTDEAGTVTAYQSMTSDSEILIDTGTWDFTLTASQNNATAEYNVLQAQCNSVQINAGNNFLNFVMQEATENAASGRIEFTLNFPKDVVTKGIATLTPYEGTNPDTQDFTANEGTTNKFLSSITYKNENISAGYYILKIQLQQSVNNQNMPINTYSCLIRVAPGLLSIGEYTLPDLAQLYTITYECGQGNIGNQLITTSYNAYTSFALPEPTLGGHYFAGWYTRDYKDDGTFTEELFGNAGDTKTISEDITLYAKYVKAYEFNLYDFTGKLVSDGYKVENGIGSVTLDNTGNSVWDYYLKSKSTDINFNANSNYKITVEMKAEADSVVAIQAANADMFFTVGKEWTPCTMETGFIEKPLDSTRNGISFGLGLSEITYFRNLVIEPISSDDDGLPTLVFDITKTGIEQYLSTQNKADKIIEVEKVEDASGMATAYNITINAPLSHQDGNSAVQDVKLHLRDYAKSVGVNNVSFEVKNTGNYPFATSFMADTASNNSMAWNNVRTQVDFSGFNTCNIDFPNYEANDELTVDVITGSDNVYSNYPVEFTISEFKVEEPVATAGPFSGKIFAIKTGDTWTQEKSVEVTIPVNGNKEFDVGMFNSWDSSQNKPSSFDDVTRFLYTGDTNITEDLSYSVNNDNPNEPKYSIANNSRSDVKVKITLDADYKVQIKEIENQPIDLTIDSLKTYFESNNLYRLPTGEYRVTGNLNLSYPIYINDNSTVKIYADDNVEITPDFTTGSMINLPMSTNSTLTLGGGDGTLTLNGTGILSGSVISSNTSLIIEDGFKLIDCDVCAINVTSGTFTMNGGEITDISREGHIINIAGGTAIFNGGSIYNNECVDLWGTSYCIYVETGTLNIPSNSTASIYKNYRSVSAGDYDTEKGAFIYNNNGTVTILGSDLAKGTCYEEAINSGSSGTVTGITYAGTDSTSSLPKFYITTAEGLATFRDMVNGTLLDETVTSYTIPADSSVTGIADYSITTSAALTNISGVLQADIDLSGIEEWIPIGNADFPFEGSFDGQNKTISNLTISNATTENQGLFGVFDCSLSDEKRCLSNICVTGSITTSSPYVGGLVGQATNIVFQNCENYIAINSSSETVGGLVGQADTCDFIGCTNYADIISTSSAIYNLCVGGIAGLITDVTAEYCYNAGDISANMSVGGIFGFEQSSAISYPTIEYCVNTGVITGSSYYGGIVGYASKALSLGYCANYGEITYSGNDDNLENGFILGGCSSSNTTRATEILSVGKSSSIGTALTNPTYYAVSKNASVTYSYYDSDKLTDIQGLSFNGGGDALSTSELINGTILDNFYYGDWNYQTGRYPIPNLKDNISAVAWDLLVRTVSEQ